MRRANRTRVDPAEFRALRLHAHEFLSDAPLHDVWCFQLRGGGSGITVRDVIDLFADIDGSRVDPAARVIGALITFVVPIVIATHVWLFRRISDVGVVAGAS